MAAVESSTLSTPKPALFVMVGVAVVVATAITVCFVLPAEFRVDPTGVGRATGVIRLAGPKKMSASELDAIVAEANGGTAVGSTGADGGSGAAAESADGVATTGNAATGSAAAGSGETAGSATAAGTGADSQARALATNAAGAGSPGVSAASNTRGASARYYAGGYRSDFVEIPLTVAGAAARGEELEYKVRMKAGDTLAYSWSVSGIANPEEFYYDFHGEAPAKDAGAEGTVVEYRQATGTQSHGTLVAPFDGVFGWYLQNQSEKPVVVHLKISGFYTLVPPGEYGNEAGIEANKPLARP